MDGAVELRGTFKFRNTGYSACVNVSSETVIDGS